MNDNNYNLSQFDTCKTVYNLCLHVIQESVLFRDNYYYFSIQIIHQRNIIK